MGKVSSARALIERKKGERDRIESELKSAKKKLKQVKRSLRSHEKAREIIREVGLKTQAQLQFHISEVASLALDSVFSNPYTLNVEFVQRRNKTECDLLFERDEKVFNPLEATGGGAVDVAAFALRTASWSMQRPRSRPLLVLDEPFKNLSTNLLPKASDMLKQMSEKAGLQIIMVTHSEELTECADKIFEVSMKKRISKVEEVL